MQVYCLCICFFLIHYTFTRLFNNGYWRPTVFISILYRNWTQSAHIKKIPITLPYLLALRIQLVPMNYVTNLLIPGCRSTDKSYSNSFFQLPINCFPDYPEFSWVCKFLKYVSSQDILGYQGTFIHISCVAKLSILKANYAFSHFICLSESTKLK